MSALRRTCGIATLILLSLSLHLARALSQQGAAGDKARFGIKPKDYVLPANAKELYRIFTFPDKEDEKNGVFLSQPGEFRASPSGLLFISDQRSNEIYVFDAHGKHVKTLGRYGQGPGEFITPSQVAFKQQYVMVRDIGNMRIQFLDESGAYKGGFKLFRDYWSFVSLGEHIFAVPIHYTFPSENKEKGLIDVLSCDGRLINSFGSLFEVNQYDSAVLTCAHIALGHRDELWVSFKYFPIVRRYSPDGTLLAEFRYSYGIVDKKESFNRTMMKRRTRYSQVPYYSICGGIVATSKGVYLLGASPERLDIFMIDQQGKISEFYWLPMESNFWCGGFHVVENNESPTFYALDHYSAKVEVYKIKKEATK
jgi:hypothetical protein